MTDSPVHSNTNNNETRYELRGVSCKELSNAQFSKHHKDNSIHDAYKIRTFRHELSYEFHNYAFDRSLGVSPTI